MILYYIANEKLYRFDGRKNEELPSTALTGYIERIYQNTKAKEWKTSGSGAIFTQTLDSTDAETRIRNISIDTSCIRYTENGVYFSQTVDATSGLYIKHDESDDGIVFSDNEATYTDFDIQNDKIVIAVRSMGESHIGICPTGSVYLSMLTEGESIDSCPTWSRYEPNTIYYASAGFAIRPTRKNNSDSVDPSPMGRAISAQQQVDRRLVGPVAVYKLNTETAEIKEILSNDHFDFIRPQTDSYGNLYFIKKPYTPNKDGGKPLSCLLDILLFPFRLIRALVGFLNIFSMVYSGKSIRQSQDVAAQNKGEKELYLDGNVINAEKELKANRKQGEKYPGIVPRSFELCRMSPSGEISVIKKGVLTYSLSENGIYYSNGSAILYQNSNGEETEVLKVPYVTSISIGEGHT